MKSLQYVRLYYLFVYIHISHMDKTRREAEVGDRWIKPGDWKPGDYCKNGLMYMASSFTVISYCTASLLSLCMQAASLADYHERLIN